MPGTTRPLPALGGKSLLSTCQVPGRGAATCLPPSPPSPGSASTAPLRPSRKRSSASPGSGAQAPLLLPAWQPPGDQDPTLPHPIPCSPVGFSLAPISQDRVITKDTSLLPPELQFTEPVTCPATCLPSVHPSGLQHPFLKISSSPTGAGHGDRPHPVPPQSSGAQGGLPSGQGLKGKQEQGPG